MFTAPVPSWLEGPLASRVQDSLSQQCFRECGWIDHGVANRLWDEFRQGNRHLAGCVWMLFMISEYVTAHTTSSTCRWNENRMAA